MIRGSLVSLRAVERDDLLFLRDWRNNSDFRKNFREVRELNMANQEQWFENICINSDNDFMFIILDSESKEVIGACGLLYINWIIRSADFSFYIGRNAEYIDSDGYALEAAQLLIGYGFNNLNLNKIWMELYEYDVAKKTLFIEEFGFKQEATLRQNCFEGGRYWDSIIISLLRGDSQ